MSSLQQQWGATTDTGKVRDHNEDGYFAAILSPPGATPVWGLYVVADGMGGHVGGEVASSIALAAVRGHVTAYYTEVSANALPDDNAMRSVLHDAVQEAHIAVLTENTSKDADMGTTVVAALVIGDRAVIANIGDSRAYIWHAGHLRQVMEDQSLVWKLWKAGTITEDEIYTHPHRNGLLRSIGQHDRLEIELPIIEHLAPGSRLLLCSDGQWEMTRNDTIALLLAQHADPQAACEALVTAANDAGGEDNITDVVIHLNP